MPRAIAEHFHKLEIILHLADSIRVVGRLIERLSKSDTQQDIARPAPRAQRMITQCLAMRTLRTFERPRLCGKRDMEQAEENIGVIRFQRSNKQVTMAFHVLCSTPPMTNYVTVRKQVTN